MEQIVRFQSKGKEIFGILHTPDQPMRQQRVGIVIVRYRTGPHRMYVQAARWWCKEGFWVLRMDFPGMGDSEGGYRYIHMDDHMDDFQIDALADAIRYFKEREAIEKVVLFGMCSGGRTVLFASAACPDVQHLIIMAMPFSNVSLGSPETALLKKTDRISSVNAKKFLLSYLKSLTKPSTWKDLFSGRNRYSFSFLVMLVNSLLKRNISSLFQDRVYTSMRIFLERQGRILFVYGSEDRVTQDFTEEFELIRPTIQGIDLFSETFIIEGANHVFSRVEWKADAIKCAAVWLNRQFPVSNKKISLPVESLPGNEGEMRKIKGA